MNSPLSSLGLVHPVLAAPMAGGPATPALVAAAARSGSLGFLAAGYKTPDLLAAQIADVRAQTGTFGVNLFVPNPVPVDRAEFDRYTGALAAEAERLGVTLAGEPTEDDDAWAAKVDLLLTVQASAAGGHSGTWTPERVAGPVPGLLALPELVAAVRAATEVPIVAAGGLSTPAEVAAALGAGAVAVMAGTALLRSDESGASAVYQAALADPGRGDPVVTRAFSGRPARGLPNRFIAEYGPVAPLGYPAVHHLTSPLRKAAAAAGDPELVNLWAGTGYRRAGTGPAAGILHELARAS